MNTIFAIFVLVVCAIRLGYSIQALNVDWHWLLGDLVFVLVSAGVAYAQSGGVA
jgi:hypothetical protein